MPKTEGTLSCQIPSFACASPWLTWQLTWVPRLWAQNPRRHFHLPYHHQIQGLSSSARWAPECQLSLGAPLLPLFLFLYLVLWLYRGLVVAHGTFCGTRTQAPDRSGPVVAALAWLHHSLWDVSSPTRDRTQIPCNAKQILNHWITREVSIVSIKPPSSYPDCLPRLQLLVSLPPASCLQPLLPPERPFTIIHNNQTFTQ